MVDMVNSMPYSPQDKELVMGMVTSKPFYLLSNFIGNTILGVIMGLLMGLLINSQKR